MPCLLTKKGQQQRQGQHDAAELLLTASEAPAATLCGTFPAAAPARQPASSLPAELLLELAAKLATSGAA